MANVELKVKSGLKLILDDLEALKKKAEDVQSALGDTGKETSNTLRKSTKETETFFGNLKSIGRRTADQLRRDFKGLVSLESISAGLKISSQFKNSLKETVELSDAIRKLGPIFGMTEKDFVSFQKKLTDGLGEIGLSSEVATKALEGLSQTQVRGDENLIAYSRSAGMLASLGREKGREAEIAKGMAGVVQSRGKNPNDREAVNELAESLRKILLATGQQPSKALADMERIFMQMPQDLRKAISTQGLANLSAIQAAGGANATKFLEEYLSKSQIPRSAIEMQGGKGIFGNNGLDLEKFKTFSRDVLGRIGMDPRAAAETLGISQEAAEGFVRLAESLDRVKEAQGRLQKTTGNLNDSYRAAMGLGESFNANVNRFKAIISTPLAAVTDFATNALNAASKSDMGAAAVVGGGGLLAAILAGRGLAGIGKAVLPTLAKGAAAESITGEKTIPVYVVNAAEIGMMSGGSSMMSGIGSGIGLFGKVVGGIGLAAAGAYGISEGVSYVAEKTGYDKDTERNLAKNLGGQLGADTYDKLYEVLSMLNTTISRTFTGPFKDAPDPRLNPSPQIPRVRQN